MTNEKFIEKMNYLGYKVVKEDYYTDVYNNYDGRPILSVKRDVLGSIDTDYSGFRYLSLDEKRELVDIAVEYTFTPMGSRTEKFYWKVKGIEGCHNYINIPPGSTRVELNTKRQIDGYTTEFTETEFKDLCEERGLIYEGYEKEEKYVY